MTTRSRASSASSPSRGAGGVDTLVDASMAVEMQLAPMGVAVGEIDRERAGRGRPAAADLVLAELEAIGQHDAGALRLAGLGVHDRLAAAAGDTLRHAGGAARAHVEIDADRRVDGIVDGVAHRA